jgi:CsoR family transcriptional regulator, copper-sensing transcriptional repressor
VLEQTQHEKEQIVARLRRIEGQVRGIQRMIEGDRDCEDIVMQLMAVRGALEKTSLLIVSRQMERCLLDSARETNREQLQRIVELMLRCSPSAAGTNAPESDAPEC